MGGLCWLGGERAEEGWWGSRREGSISRIIGVQKTMKDGVG